MPRPRPVLLLALMALAAAAVLAACGGSGPSVKPASARTDARQLLRDTFKRGNELKSGQVDAQLTIRARGTGGPIRLRLSGPFASEGAGRLPRFQYALAAEGAGRDVQAGLTWTGKAAFVAFQGAQYAVPAALARQFQAGYEEAVKRGGKGGVDAATLGIDPASWLRDARTAGEVDVAGTPTVRVTGEADVARALDDVQRLARRARSLNLPGASGSASLTPAERRQALAAVKALSVQVYTGKADRVLRRLSAQAALRDPSYKGLVHLDLDVTFRGVNEDQDIVTPQGARPLSELTSKLGVLGSLGAGLGSSASGSGKQGLDAYADCVQQAGADAAKRQKCASLLGP
jgi:predicted small lipoprotein YifL